MKSSKYVIYLKKRMNMGKCTSCILYIKQNPTTHTRDNEYDYEVMTRRKYKITRCNILQKDF
jgi:hypothetical protein